MSSKLGLHWLREHPDNDRDFAHIERMQYRSIKLFKPAWDNRDFCRDLLTVLPHDAYILARDHDLSEQKQDMWGDAKAAGINHANQWIDKVKRGLYHMPLDRTFFLGVNEPDATHGDRDKIDRYTEAFLRTLQNNGLRGGAFNFSTGHPRTVDGTPNTAADYTVFERSHRAIVEGHHIAVLHIYGTAAEPLAPGHYDRLKACTWTDVEWVVGEAGADEHVIGGGPHDGYLRSMAANPAGYCDWMDNFIIGINDARIHSYQIFTHDFSHPWDSFDIRPIRDAMESHQWRHMSVPATKPPVDTHLPSVIAPGPQPPPEPTPAYVIAPAGARLRSIAPDGNTLAIVPYGDAVAVRSKQVLGDDETWANVDYGEHSGWVADWLLGPTKPAETPEPPPVTTPTRDDCWRRAWPIVLKFEGGLSLDPNDKGNWYNGKLIGTKFGISAAVWGGQYDIPNLTQEQALSIYKQHYFDAAGADSLPWPMCLAVFDHAVNAGVGSAKQLLAKSGPNFLTFMSERISWYTRLAQFNLYGPAWIRRCAEILREGAK